MTLIGPLPSVPIKGFHCIYKSTRPNPDPFPPRPSCLKPGHRQHISDLKWTMEGWPWTKSDIIPLQYFYRSEKKRSLSYKLFFERRPSSTSRRAFLDVPNNSAWPPILLTTHPKLMTCTNANSAHSFPSDRSQHLEAWKKWFIWIYVMKVSAQRPITKFQSH